MGESSAFPSWHVALLPSSETQPAVPAFWVRAPVVVLRSRIATAPEAEATYTLLPSALTVRFWASTSAFPSWQAPPVPVSETQPAVPPFWASSPTAHAAAGRRNAARRAASANRHLRAQPRGGFTGARYTRGPRFRKWALTAGFLRGASCPAS